MIIHLKHVRQHEKNGKQTPMSLCGIVDTGHLTYGNPSDVTCMICIGRFNGMNMQGAILLANQVSKEPIYE